MSISTLEEKISEISKQIKESKKITETLVTVAEQGISLMSIAWPVAKIVASIAYDAFLKVL